MIKKTSFVLLALIVIATMFVGCTKDYEKTIYYTGTVENVFVDDDGEIFEAVIKVNGWIGATTFMISIPVDENQPPNVKELRLGGFEIQKGDGVAIENRYGQSDGEYFDYFIITSIDKGGN